MWLDFALALLCTALIIVLAWSFKGRLLMPVSIGGNTKITTSIEVTGSEPCLENTLKSIVWMHENGTLKASVVLNIDTDDPTVHHVAQAYALNYWFINCDYGDNSWKS
ncbi:MAG: hypothetical protein Q4A83_01805 [Bacillota bacterium]|nr:hypothetical protein [Bacillota bacterium]